MSKEFSPRFPSKNLSLKDLRRVSAMIGTGLSLTAALTACGLEPSPASAAEPQPNNDIPSAMATEASPTIEPSPTAETLPASLEANRSALTSMDYEVRQGERGWELVSPQNQVVLVASDNLTIQAFGPNNEVILSPEQAFGISSTMALGMEKLLTLTDAQGKPTHTFLERAGYWAPVMETQDNPREIANYPFCPIESIWNRALAQTEALSLKPFPKESLVPDSFEYFMWFGAGGYWVQLENRVHGFYDMDIRYRKGLINTENYYRRFVNFCRSTTPEGVDVVIGTEQIRLPENLLASSGEDQGSLLIHYVFGPEWSWEEDARYSNTNINLIDSVFLGHVEPPRTGMSSVALRPIVYSATYADGSLFGDSFTRQPNAGITLYGLHQNSPVSVRADLEALFQQEASIDQNRRPIAVAGNEVSEFQYMGFTSTSIYGFSQGSDISSMIFNLP